MLCLASHVASASRSIPAAHPSFNALYIAWLSVGVCRVCSLLDWEKGGLCGLWPCGGAMYSCARRPAAACSPWPRAPRFSTPWRYSTPEQGCGRAGRRYESCRCALGRVSVQGVRGRCGWRGFFGCAQDRGGVVSMLDGVVTFKGGTISSTRGVRARLSLLAQFMARCTFGCCAANGAYHMVHMARSARDAYSAVQACCGCVLRVVCCTPPA
jgi:hypothetical protein